MHPMHCRRSFNSTYGADPEPKRGEAERSVVQRREKSDEGGDQESVEASQEAVEGALESELRGFDLRVVGGTRCGGMGPFL